MVQLDRATGKGLKVSTVSGLATSPKAGKKTSKACNDYVDGSPKKAMYAHYILTIHSLYTHYWYTPTIHSLYAHYTHHFT
jgi:hypothetical protein